MKFQDKLTFDAEHKTVVSCRDGIMEYYGAEIGREPADKVFKVYRSPETVKRIKDEMVGIPITDEHVDVSAPIGDQIKKGEVKDSTIVDIDGDNGESVALKHTVAVDKRFKPILDGGKIEVSLGYLADLVPHDTYDFEQVNIVPHHLAVVMAGRCGDACKFTDKGNILEEIIKLIEGLTEEQKKKLLEKLGAKSEPMDISTKPVTDTAEFKLAIADAKAEFEKKLGEVKVKLTDEAKAEYKQEVLAEYKERMAVCDKAKKFLGEAYVFDGKDTKHIMADALAKEYSGVEFADGEIAGAFKALQLKSVDDYKSFGDSKKSAWDDAAEMEV